jgi:hypothetical protein
MKQTLNEEIQRVREIMGLKSKPIIIESRQSEEVAVNFLRKNNIDDAENIVKEFASSDKSENQKNIPIMAYLYVLEIKKSGSPNIEQIIGIVNEYNDLLIKKRIEPIQVTKNGLKIGENIFNDYLKFTEHIHGLSASKTGEYKISQEKLNEFKAEKKPLWSGNGIDIYEGNSIGKCIAYSQGALTGKQYSFCIGKPGPQNMYKSYRDSQVSTFYFIIDKNRFKIDENNNVDLSDPLHIVVFDRTNRGVLLTDANNKTGNIAEYGEDANKYIDYLKQKGVPVDELLVNKPKTEQEIYEDNLLGRKNDDLNWFINLDNPIRPDYKKPKLEPGDPETNYYKWAYIGRGHTLSNEQFDFLMGK